jgi:phage baseplate assembly protein V
MVIMNIAQQISRFLEPVKIRIRMIVNRAIVSIVDDSTSIQLLQLKIFKDEIKDNAERVQNYGFTSVPTKDSEAVVLFPNGNKDQGLVIAVDNSQYRLKGLPDGGVALYHKDGHYVKLTESGIEIVAPVGITIGGSATVPSTPGVTGSFCAIPSCLFTGSPHLTNKVTG